MSELRRSHSCYLKCNAVDLRRWVPRRNLRVGENEKVYVYVRARVYMRFVHMCVQMSERDGRESDETDRLR